MGIVELIFIVTLPLIALWFLFFKGCSHRNAVVRVISMLLSMLITGGSVLFWFAGVSLLCLDACHENEGILRIIGWVFVIFYAALTIFIPLFAVVRTKYKIRIESKNKP